MYRLETDVEVIDVFIFNIFNIQNLINGGNLFNERIKKCSNSNR